jgi:hypothetical protein
MDINRLRQIRVELLKEIEPPMVPSLAMDIEPNPCWEGYEPIGLKDDGSPNCVPIKEEQSKEKFVIPEPGESETQDEYIGRCISSIVDEYGQEQAAGICYGQWDKK